MISGVNYEWISYLGEGRADARTYVVQHHLESRVRSTGLKAS